MSRSGDGELDRPLTSAAYQGSRWRSWPPGRSDRPHPSHLRRAVLDLVPQGSEVTRLYLETLNEVLPKTGRKLIIDASMKGIVPLLNLDAAKQEVKP
jgi:hypothetical protein